MTPSPAPVQAGNARAAAAPLQVNQKPYVGGTDRYYHGTNCANLPVQHRQKEDVRSLEALGYTPCPVCGGKDMAATRNSAARRPAREELVFQTDQYAQMTHPRRRTKRKT